MQVSGTEVHQHQRVVRSAHMSSPRRIVIYGDFNCPYSYLASVRADRLLENGAIDLEWRAVEHDPTIPSTGQPVEGETATALAREIAEVLSVVGKQERFVIQQPLVRSNTAEAVARFASTAGQEAHELRRMIFAAIWQGRQNVTSAGSVRDVTGRDDADPETATAWRGAWLDFGPPWIPTLVVAGGDQDVIRGLDADRWLENPTP